MKIDKVEVIVPIIAILCGLMLTGLVVDIWQMVFVPIPIMTMALIFLGSLSREGRWGPTIPVLTIYGVILLAIFVWISVSMGSTELFGGLEKPMGIIYYVLWPFTTVLTGFIYAWVYSRWLSHDMEDAPSTAPQSQRAAREQGRA